MDSPKRTHEEELRQPAHHRAAGAEVQQPSAQVFWNTSTSAPKAAPADNPARKTAKPRRLPSTRGALADAVDKSPAAVRQIAYRARAHVAARRPHGIASPERPAPHLQSLLDFLAPDGVALSDGGGVVTCFGPS